MEQLLSLRESLKHYDTSDFQSILIDELLENANDLPLEDHLHFGGWPDTDGMEISVLKVVRREDEVRATVRCAFDEAVPSACRDLPWKEPAIADFDVVLDIRDNAAYVDDGEAEDEEQSSTLPFDFG